MKSLKILSALSMFAAAYATESYYNDRETREVPKGDSNRKKIHPTSKQGQNTFNYQDGFTCQALNQKNADKKHRRWLKSKS